jgi:hypothetical protein
MGRRADPRRLVDVQAGIVLTDHNRLARMHPHPHPHRTTIGPRVSGQCLLCSHRRRHRLARLAERDEKGLFSPIRGCLEKAYVTARRSLSTVPAA